MLSLAGNMLVLVSHNRPSYVGLQFIQETYRTISPHSLQTMLFLRRSLYRWLYKMDGVTQVGI